MNPTLHPDCLIPVNIEVLPAATTGWGWRAATHDATDDAESGPQPWDQGSNECLRSFFAGSIGGSELSEFRLTTSAPCELQ